MTVTSPRSTARAFDTVPPIHDYANDIPAALRFVWNILNQLMRGKTNNVTPDFTLTLSSTTTVVTDERIGANSWIGLMPIDALAAGEMGIYVLSQGKQTCTISHGSGSNTRTFRMVIVG